MISKRAVLEARKKKNKKSIYDSISYTTGDIGLNIDRFNKAVGSYEQSLDNTDNLVDTNMTSDNMLLSESKRYVRRYYMRPQNIFCSNKTDILKALIDIKNQNCTIYTLNNLGDEKDVTKLTNNDIIYYYDDGILYDKNKIKVMDYELAIKKEENRRKISDMNSISNKEFKTEYDDRMTEVTELEEAFSEKASLMDAFANCDYDVIEADYTIENDIIVVLNHNVADIHKAAENLIRCLAEADIKIIDWDVNGSNVFIFKIDLEDAFNQKFKDINVYGESLTEAKETYCCICGEPLDGYGNNPEPYMSSIEGLCCDSCNLKFVIPARLALIDEE